MNFKLAFLSFIFFVFASVLAPAPAAYAADGGLEQDSDNYYLIGSAADLAAFRDGVNNGTYAYSSARLTRDITLTEENWTPIGDGSCQYSGTFDGGGHTISGLVINSSDQYVGLFGYVGSDGAVQNLTLKEPSLTASNSSARVGAIAGRNDGTIKNCRVSGGSVTGGYCTGGVVGYNYSGKVSNCTNSGDVTSGSYSTSSASSAGTGGVVGYNYSGIVSNCANSGDVTDRINRSFSPAGGVVGYNGNSKVSNCTNSGDVTKSTSNSSCYIGGVIGDNRGGTVSNCANSGSVTAANSSNYIGGVVGYNSTSSSGPASVSNCGFLKDSAAKGIGQQSGSSTNTNVVSFSSEEMAKIAVTLSAHATKNSVNPNPSYAGDAVTITLVPAPAENLSNVYGDSKGIRNAKAETNDTDIIIITDNEDGTFTITPAPPKSASTGTAEITITANLYEYNFSTSSYSSTSYQTIKFTRYITVSNVQLESITITTDSETISNGIGGTTTLTAAVSPSNAQYDAIEWKSEDESIATVEAGEGNMATVTATGAGTVKITATAGGVTGECEITVDEVSATGVTINNGAGEITLNEGGSAQLEISLEPSNSTDKITWTSSDYERVYVDGDGKITAVSPGVATITATTESSETANITIIVTEAETEAPETPDDEETGSSSSGGGGCNAGTGALALLALIPLALRRKR